MTSLSTTELRRLHRSILTLYAAEDLEKFPQRAAEAVAQLIDNEKTAYNEISLRSRRLLRFVASGAPYSPEQLHTFERHIHEHPLVGWSHEHPEHPPVRMSDFLTPDEFHRTGLYSEFFKPLEVEYQMAVGIATRPDVIIGIALNRKLADFSVADRAMLELLRPHLQQAYRNAAAMEQVRRRFQEDEDLLRAVAPTTAIISAGGKIHEANQATRRLLEQYYGRPGAGGPDWLPDEVRDWLRHQFAALAADALGRWCLPLLREQPGRWLILRLIVRTEDRHYLVLHEHSIEQRAVACQRLGLTRRQAQILAWMTMGRTGPEIAAILRANPRTVEKHIEHIYHKLGVQTRLEAVIRALELCR
ncbi:MAG: hypothetical protein HKL95_07565 [Phycisphaerae bacterium]|nr:hypothetical protein [Phycisphaerae bacterium]